MEQLLALFPLNVVLFPGNKLPLHIFEERYKQMIGRCIRQNEPFGVVLIREGLEVGGDAEPFDVGTTAQILNAVRFEGGEMVIAAEGRTRFRIRRIVQEKPFLLAEVELLEEQVTIDHRTQADQLRNLYDRYRELMSLTGAAKDDLEELPDDPLLVSYQLSGKIHVPNQSKQQLLEADLETRLEALIAALNDELRYLPEPPGQQPPSDRRWSLN